jgi:nanoRNase/pAp phosphatase (c-di-AMP/oligoRNAs hydrolase)
MALNTHEQLISMLERSLSPIIVLAEQASLDDFTAAYSCASLLAKMNKPVDIVTSGGISPKAIDFLTSPAPVRGDIEKLRKMTLRIKSAGSAGEVVHREEDGDLVIDLLPESGVWSADDVEITSDAYRHDLVIAIGCPDLESLGMLHEKYADFFFDTPIVNIDCAPKNEHYGQFNYVDVNAVACSEVCHDLFERVDETLIDEEVATSLLTGMIHKTKSFKSENVTPRTLKTASSLIARGARRAEIVEKLYKTRSVETLRLWGRALARLKNDERHGIVWTLLTKQDFVRAGTDNSSLDSIVDELISSSPNTQVAAVFYESDGEVHVMLHAARPHDALALGAPFRAAGTREEAQLVIREGGIVDAEKIVVSHLKDMLEG